MKLPENSILLRIFLGEKDHCKGKPLYEKIIYKARELNMAGATVIRGIMGFGANSRIHTVKLLSLSEDLPIIIEIVDKKEKIDNLLPFLEEVIKDGMITMEEIKVIKYSHNKTND